MKIINSEYSINSDDSIDSSSNLLSYSKDESSMKKVFVLRK
jgi:hypothetical protein